VGGDNVDLNAEALVGALLGPQCLTTAATRAAQLVRINGAAPQSAVQVNVVETSVGGADGDVSVGTFATDFVCYRYARDCPLDERIVVNIFVSSWCASGCVASRATPPTCFGERGCVRGKCVDTDRCVCDAGFDGQRCATRAGCETTACSGHGVCQTSTAQCQCADGFVGSRCESRAATPKPTSPPAGGAPAAPAAHGDTLDADQTWLLPFRVFPEGNFSHFGVLSSGQLPQRINWKQNGREPLEQPFTQKEVNAQGYVAVNADYAARKLTYEIVFTVPKGELATGQVGPVAELFNGALGFTGAAAVGTLDGGYWCVVPSWVSLEWEAWKLNGTLTFDAATAGALSASESYVQLRTADRPHGALRAQLSRFDTIAKTKLVAAAPLSAEGAGVFFLDSQTHTAQFWVYYTAPLDYIEVGATINAAGGDERFPLPVGTVGLRRVGPYDRTKTPPASYVCALSKQGVWRFGADAAPRLTNGSFVVVVASNDQRDGALLGTINE
jgi:hypothetical protein